MCAKNAQENLQEKLSYLKEFVEQSTRLEKQVQSTLNDVQQIRDEIETLLSKISGLRVSGLQEFFENGEEAEDLEFPGPDQPVDQKAPDAAGEAGDEDASSSDDEESYEEPLKAGEFPGDQDLDWEPDNGRSTDDGRGETDAISTAEGETSSYRRRMVRKDPRLEDVPEDVLDSIARAEDLFQEAERGIQVLESLSVQSRSAQLAIWAARARKIQDQLEEWSDVLPDDFSRKMHVFFGKLTTVTREHECQWIDALKRSFSTDWDQYLEEQKRKLRLSLQREKRAREFLKEPPRERKKDRKICRRRLRELASEDDPSTDEVKSVLIEGMDLLAMDDPAVIEVAERFSDLLEEDDALQPLKEVIEERRTDAEREREESDQPQVYRRPTLGPEVPEKILKNTRDQRAIALADEVTNEWKRRIEDAFQFEDFTWLDIAGEEDSVSEVLDRENADQYHYVLLMKSRLQEEYSQALEKCRDLSAETLVVEEGVGVAPIREAFEDELAETA